jgi:WD40 repeat protein
VTALGFSYDGQLLASCGLDNSHMVFVWDWQHGRCLFSAAGGADKILDVCWSPVEYTFCTGGIKHIYFWA